MKLLHFIFYFASIGCVSAAGNCSYMALIESLGLSDTNVQMTSLRPVHNWTTPTGVFIDLYVSSITAVNEKAQSFSTQVTLLFGWENEFTVWNPANFCGISECSIRKEMIWYPDIGILESIETKFASLEDPYVQLMNNGLVIGSATLAVTTACKMDLYKFPFDVQICTLTLLSPVHTNAEVKLYPITNSSVLTVTSQKIFRTEGEWDLVSINETKGSAITLGHEQDQLIFQITISRRPILYVINFMLPVFYFLVLDVASFFVDAKAGKKLSFKVTLLLAIAVLLRLLNDMLPSTASAMPLIGVYCTVIFTLIAVSILESIIVTFLKSKGEAATSKPSTSDAVKEPQEVSDAVVEKKDEISHTLELLKILREFQSSSRLQHQEQKSSRWTRLATIIDFTFFFLYLLANSVFLAMIYLAWTTD